MSSIGTGYDLSAHQFSPDGRVFQVEYANKAVQNSSTAVALRCKDGVVFGVEKLITSKLYEPGTGRRIFSIDRHIGMAVSGLMSDARQIVGIARNEAAYYRSIYGSPIPLKTLSDKVAGYIHVYTLYSAYRPFGCSVFLSSYDKVDGPELYMIEPSGTSYRPVEICGSMLPLGKFYNIGKEGGMNFLSNALLHDSFKGYSGCSVGKAKQNAKTEIEKLKLENLTMKEGIKEVAKIIHIVHDEVKDKHFELELSWVGEGTNGIHQMVPKELANDAEEHAKKAIEEDSDSDDDL